MLNTVHGCHAPKFYRPAVNYHSNMKIRCTAFLCVTSVGPLPMQIAVMDCLQQMSEGATGVFRPLHRLAMSLEHCDTYGFPLVDLKPDEAQARRRCAAREVERAER